MLFCSCVFSVLLALRLLAWERKANLSAFRTFVRFAFVWFCLFPLPHGLQLVIVAIPVLFSYLFLLFFVCASVVSYVAFVMSLLVLISPFIMSKEGCVWHFLGIFTDIFVDVHYINATGTSEVAPNLHSRLAK